MDTKKNTAAQNIFIAFQILTVAVLVISALSPKVEGKEITLKNTSKYAGHFVVNELPPCSEILFNIGDGIYGQKIFAKNGDILSAAKKQLYHGHLLCFEEAKEEFGRSENRYFRAIIYYDAENEIIVRQVTEVYSKPNVILLNW